MGAVHEGALTSCASQVIKPNHSLPSAKEGSGKSHCTTCWSRHKSDRAVAAGAILVGSKEPVNQRQGLVRSLKPGKKKLEVARLCVGFTISVTKLVAHNCGISIVPQVITDGAPDVIDAYLHSPFILKVPTPQTKGIVYT